MSQMTPWIGMTMLLALAAAAPVRADLKVGVVDMQRALNDCDAGKKARDQVKAKFEKAQDQLKRQREDLDRLRQDYDKKAVVLKEEERRNLEKDLDYGEKHGYSFVLEASNGALLYNDKATDITDDIIKLYNTSPHHEGARSSKVKE